MLVMTQTNDGKAKSGLRYFYYYFIRMIITYAEHYRHLDENYGNSSVHFSSIDRLGEMRGVVSIISPSI